MGMLKAQMSAVYVLPIFAFRFGIVNAVLVGEWNIVRVVFVQDDANVVFAWLHLLQIVPAIAACVFRNFLAFLQKVH
ncbi:Uncharacterised protein [Klebsiella pneumoniae]|nr:Uncharacterised protein [Klebsiella pneumoniae]